MVQLKRILFPTDFSDFSSFAASFAISFACDYGAKLHVLHVVETQRDVSGYLMEKASMEEISAKVEKLAEEEVKSACTEEMLSKLDYDLTCVKGNPFLEIIKFAREKEIDMIVMGTHGRSALTAALIGSTAEKVVRKAPCPVFSVRMPGHKFIMPAIG